MTKSFRGKGLIGGRARGVAVMSAKAFTFAHGVDPATGLVTDVHSDIKGDSVKGKILFYPFGKGSTTASAWFLETARLGNTPAALVTEATDLSAVIGSILAKVVYGRSIPVLSSFTKEMYSVVKDGARVEVDGSAGTVVVPD